VIDIQCSIGNFHRQETSTQRSGRQAPSVRTNFYFIANNPIANAPAAQKKRAISIRYDNAETIFACMHTSAVEFGGPAALQNGLIVHRPVPGDGFIGEVFIQGIFRKWPFFRKD
jgi:hypothetical protein